MACSDNCRPKDKAYRCGNLHTLTVRGESVMVVSLRKWIERAKFIALFVVLTFVLYQIISVLSVWMEPVHKYKQPSGGAVKVFKQEQGTMDAKDIPDRLKLFYWYGE